MPAVAARQKPGPASLAGGDPLGRRIRSAVTTSRSTIVGVVGDVRQYWYDQGYCSSRTSGRPAAPCSSSCAAQARGRRVAAARAASTRPIRGSPSRGRTMATVVSGSASPIRLSATLAATLGRWPPPGRSWPVRRDRRAREPPHHEIGIGWRSGAPRGHPAPGGQPGGRLAASRLAGASVRRGRLMIACSWCRSLSRSRWPRWPWSSARWRWRRVDPRAAGDARRAPANTRGVGLTSGNQERFRRRGAPRRSSRPSATRARTPREPPGPRAPGTAAGP